jgi:hypothetical protein
MIKVLFLFLLLTSFFSRAQEDTVDFKFPPALSLEITEQDFLSCDYTMKPQYKGGIPALRNYISGNFCLDQTDTCNLNQKYKCKLIISTTGSVSKVEITSYPEFSSCEKCKRKLEKILFSMQWIPAEIEGIKIVESISFPVKIELNN